MSTPRLTVTSYVVLGLLALRGPSTSYELKRAVGHSVGYFWPFPHAQLYSEPRRLAAGGLLEVDEETEGRRRQTFTLTDAGREALQEWLEAPTPEQMQVRDVAELKLFFGELTSPDGLRALADDQVRQHTERLRVYSEMAERFGDQPEVAARLVPLRLGIALEETSLKFWSELREEN